MADINIGCLQIMIAICSMTFIGCAPSHHIKCRELREYKKIFPDGTEACVPCSKCHRGQCFVNHCFEYTDTACRKPRQNEYIEKHVCTVCSDCGERRAVRKNCTKHSDTLCGDCLKGYRWDSMLDECLPLENKHESAFRQSPFTSESFDSGRMATTSNLKMNDKSTTLIPTGIADQHIESIFHAPVGVMVGASVSGMVIVVLILVVFLKRNHKHKQQDKKTTNNTEDYGQHALQKYEVAKQLLIGSTVDDEPGRGVENATIRIDCISNKDSNTIKHHPAIEATTTCIKDKNMCCQVSRGSNEYQKEV